VNPETAAPGRVNRKTIARRERLPALGVSPIELGRREAALRARVAQSQAAVEEPLPAQPEPEPQIEAKVEPSPAPAPQPTLAPVPATDPQPVATASGPATSVSELALFVVLGLIGIIIAVVVIGSGALHAQ
jgi:hypothetical protein